jgi:hypothetical protein
MAGEMTHLLGGLTVLRQVNSDVGLRPLELPNRMAPLCRRPARRNSGTLEVCWVGTPFKSSDYPSAREAQRKYVTTAQRFTVQAIAQTTWQAPSNLPARPSSNCATGRDARPCQRRHSEFSYNLARIGANASRGHFRVHVSPAIDFEVLTKAHVSPAINLDSSPSLT